MVLNLSSSLKEYFYLKISVKRLKLKIEKFSNLNNNVIFFYFRTQVLVVR